jgi:hypothetical protein
MVILLWTSLIKDKKFMIFLKNSRRNKIFLMKHNLFLVGIVMKYVSFDYLVQVKEILRNSEDCI